MYLSRPEREDTGEDSCMAELKLNSGRATLAVGDASSVTVLDSNQGDSVSIIETKGGTAYAVISTGDKTTVQTRIARIDLATAQFDASALTGTTYTDKDGIGTGEGATREDGALGLIESTRLELAKAIKEARVKKGLEKEVSAPVTPTPSPEAKPAPTESATPKATPAPDKTTPAPAATQPPLDPAKIVVDKKISAEEQALMKQAINTPAFVEFVKGKEGVKSAAVSRSGSAEIELKDGGISLDKEGAITHVRSDKVGGNVLKSPFKDQALESVEKTFKELITEFNAKR